MQRLLLQAVVYARTLIMRTGPGGVIALAIAGVGLLWMLRGRRNDNDNDRNGNNGRQRRGRSSRRTYVSRRDEGRGGGIGGMRGVRKITVGMESGVDGMQSMAFVKEEGKLRLKDGVAGVLGKLGRVGDVFVVVKVASDEEEEDVLACLDCEKVFGKGVSKDRVVFCETISGRVSIARQIESHLHVDSNVEVIAGLQRFIKYVRLIGEGDFAGPAKGSNIAKFDSYAAFLERGLAE